MVQKRRGGILSMPSRALVPPMKIVLVQPTEKCKPNNIKKEESLKKIDISPDFSALAIKSAEITRCEPVSRSPPPPPPLPEPPTVDKDAILREVLSDEESIVSSMCSSLGKAPSEIPDNDSALMEEVSLDVKPQRQEPGVGTPAAPSEDGRKSAEDRERLVRLFDQLLADIYAGDEGQKLSRRASEYRITKGKSSVERLSRHHSHCGYLETLSKVEPALDLAIGLSIEELNYISCEELEVILQELKWKVFEAGEILVEGLEERDKLVTEHQGLCDLMTASLQAISAKRSEDTEVRFSVGPGGGDSGFAEWAKAMKMVARLPDGVPPHFRKTLWLSLAEKHLASKNISWPQVERSIFSDRLNPDDQELSVQIVKDLHRTGCSLFCGASGQHNQAVLKRVLLAYARWNKTVGYCQGLNMLAALILQVMQGCQGATVKVMIYLIEGVLPESYFADNLRGLSVDMAVFRDLLSLKVPQLSQHLDNLQQEARESGTSYEPPLMDVFTMQWFLTIFCNCLPQPTVLRLWDLLFLEGDAVLIKAALVIWQNLSERMLSVRSADEFYSIMAVLTREMMEFGLMDANSIIKAMDLLTIPELSELREGYMYSISPWPVAAKRGLRIFYPHRHQGRLGDESREPRMTPISNHPDREKIALDISALKKQYWKLRERQRQAHIILSAACRSENYSTQSSPALNHLLLGKSALKSVKARSRKEGDTLHWKDARRQGEVPGTEKASPSEPIEEPPTIRRLPAERRVSSSSSSSSSTELCDSSDSEGEEAARKRDDLMRILKENSEMLGRFRHHSTSPEEPGGRLTHHQNSPDEPEDIKDIRRRYSADPFPVRATIKQRELGVKLGLYSQPS